MSFTNDAAAPGIESVEKADEQSRATSIARIAESATRVRSLTHRFHSAGGAETGKVVTYRCDLRRSQFLRLGYAQLIAATALRSLTAYTDVDVGSCQFWHAINGEKNRRHLAMPPALFYVPIRPMVRLGIGLDS